MRCDARTASLSAENRRATVQHIHAVHAVRAAARRRQRAVLDGQLAAVHRDQRIAVKILAIRRSGDLAVALDRQIARARHLEQLDPVRCNLLAVQVKGDRLVYRDALDLRIRQQDNSLAIAIRNRLRQALILRIAYLRYISADLNAIGAVAVSLRNVILRAVLFRHGAGERTAGDEFAYTCIRHCQRRFVRAGAAEGAAGHHNRHVIAGAAVRIHDRQGVCAIDGAARNAYIDGMIRRVLRDGNARAKGRGAVAIAMIFRRIAGAGDDHRAGIRNDQITGADLHAGQTGDGAAVQRHRAGVWLVDRRVIAAASRLRIFNRTSVDGDDRVPAVIVAIAGNRIVIALDGAGIDDKSCVLIRITVIGLGHFDRAVLLTHADLAVTARACVFHGQRAAVQHRDQVIIAHTVRIGDGLSVQVKRDIAGNVYARAE